jgi:malonyl-CoA O-methyltransferase
MAERLAAVRIAPRVILDAGCGTGESLAELGARYPAARAIGLDVALPMLLRARERSAARVSMLGRVAAMLRGGATGEAALVAGDIAALPLGHASVDLLWSNLALQWMPDLPRAFAELHRVLAIDGLLMFSTLGPDTLKELRRAFGAAGGHPHVSRFADMHDVGDMLVRQGFADPVMHMEYLTLTYAEPRAVMRDLKALGATNALAARPRGLMGRARLAAVLDALERERSDGRIPATFEVVYGHAWKVPPTRTPEGHPIVRVERRRP